MREYINKKNKERKIQNSIKKFAEKQIKNISGEKKITNTNKENKMESTIIGIVLLIILILILKSGLLMGFRDKAKENLKYYVDDLLTLECTGKEIKRGVEIFNSYGSYWMMFLNPFKWSYNQYYPKLGKRLQLYYQGDQK